MKLKSFVHAAWKALLILAAFVGLMQLAHLSPAPCEFVNQYATSDVTYADGRTAHFDNKNFGRLDKGDAATLHLRLPEQPIFEPASLVFYNYNAVTEVWFGETLLDSYGADLAARDMMIGNRYFLIGIPREAWGGEITVIVRGTMDNAFANFTNLRLFPAEHAYRYFIDTDPFGFCQ